MRRAGPPTEMRDAALLRGFSEGRARTGAANVELATPNVDITEPA
jgi:hypothetical protein